MREALKLALGALYALAAMNYTTQQMKSNAITAIKEALAQPEQDLSEQGRNRSAVLGNNVQAMMDAGLPFLKALETTLKVYDHDVPKLGCVNHDCDKCVAQPEQRTWVGLTLSDREQLRDQFEDWNYPAILVDVISDKLKEKNT